MKKCYFLSLLALSLLSVFIITSKDASAISITSVNRVGETFVFEAVGNDMSQHWYRNNPTGNNSIPQALVAQNPTRKWTYLIGLGVDMPISAGTTSKTYNRYRLGLTLRQYSQGTAPVNSLRDNLGRYSVSIEGITNAGNHVSSTDCGYEIGDNFISHICYIQLDGNQTLTSASWSLGDHSQLALVPSLGYVILVDNQSDIILSDLTLLVESSDDQLIAGQKLLIENTNIINSNIVDFKNQNHEDLENINNSLNNFNRVMEEGNDDAQSRWEQDKQEEVDREEALQDDADAIGGMFNFTFTNPFTAFLALFTDGGSCVSIPIIAGMVHSQQTTYCPWFSASTRNILTPVITLGASVILVGFLVGWLNGNDFNGPIKIKERK